MMAAELACDDVIRIRIDTGWVVQDFLDQLAAQAAEGETRAPANPANRAVFRELAPFRLVEYAYVDEALGIDGAHVGFADGSIYSVSDEIPEAVVDDLVRGEPAGLPPIYLYILPSAPCSAAAAEHFVAALAGHLGRSLVAVYGGADGGVTARAFEGDVAATEAERARLSGEVARAAGEGARHLSRRQVLERYNARVQGEDGRAWAQVSFNFERHVVEFDSVADRDDFIRWSHALCAGVQARWCNWGDLGFTDLLRPAEVAPAPKGEVRAVPLVPPAKAMDGRPWQAFSEGTVTDDAAALAFARDYWEYCTATLRAAAAAERQRLALAG
jgi:hypothetical protein